MVDLHFECETLTSEAAFTALGYPANKDAEDPYADVRGAFFQSLSVDADQNRRFRGLKYIQTDFAHENKHAITVSGLRKLRVYKLSNVRLVPARAGQFSCAFRVTLEHPPESYIDALSNKINSLVKVRLDQDGDLFDAATEEPAAVETKDLLTEQDTKPNKRTKDRSLTP
jgi:hypothetical protein